MFENKSRHELESIIESLLRDSVFGGYTRQAIELTYNDLYPLFTSVIFFDVDYMHQMNDNWGYNETDKRIRESLENIRKSDIKSYRWLQGDEIVIFLTSGDSIQFSERIQREFNNNGISVTIGINEHITDDLYNTVTIASDKTQKAKNENRRGTINK